MSELVLAPFRAGGARFLFERNLMVYRRVWMVIFSGFFEPLLYLFSFGYGLGHFIGNVQAIGGRVSYASFVAPALLAASAMNGAVYEAGNVFWKLRYRRTYDAVVTTPVEAADVAVGETAWSLFRGLIYAVGFIVLIASLGLIHSTWAVLALPAATLIGFCFAGLAVASTTFMRSWQDFDLIQLVQLPMFLFTTTFYPLSVYPHAVQWFVRVTPLYNAIELMRGLTLGTIGWSALINVAYLAAIGALGLVVATRRIDRVLLS